MKKVYCLILVFFPFFLQAEVIVTKHNGNIENVSDVDTTESVIYFIHDYETKSINRNDVVAIIYEDGKYQPISHAVEEYPETNSDDVLWTQRSESAWVDFQVGALRTFPDGSQGIIFYSTDDGHGLAVSMRETKAKWDISKRKDMKDIPEIPNNTSVQPIITKIGEGAYYTAVILQQLPSYLCPAASWCSSIGEGWYLPTASELLYLFQIANRKLEERGPISRALEANGGTKLAGGWYWTCSESDRTEVFNITDGGFSATEDKDKNNTVRAIRAF